ncbi:MAG: hypothetical protein IKJ72_00600 [Mycoplasmataceae bacterium]|nr:hypothetical protein [Mycoplasmataceae bacterium]
MNNVIQFISKKQKALQDELFYMYNQLDELQKRSVIASYILKFNDRECANKLCGYELNDLNFQRFKRMLKKKWL